MKAAIVYEPDAAPVYGDIEPPTAGPGEVRIAVAAAALSQVTRSRASGHHYSAGGAARGRPVVPGIDGVGQVDGGPDAGRRVYFVLPRAPFGAMAECSVAPAAHCVPVPDGLDDVTAAALVNPGLSSWAALTERAKFAAGETVLVHGATGTAGRLAVRIARHLGAARVIATGRDRAALAEVAASGADATVPLGEDPDALEAAFTPHFAAGVAVVLDYLWGPSAERLLVAAARAGRAAVPIRFVQIGSVSAQEITLPSAVLRSSALQLMGSGINSVPLDRLVRASGAVLAAAGPAGLRVATREVPLADVERTWDAAGTAPRTVFRVG